MLDLESQGLGSIPTGRKYHFLFYNPNLYNIARSGRIRFKMKNPTDVDKNNDNRQFMTAQAYLGILCQMSQYHSNSGEKAYSFITIITVHKRSCRKVTPSPNHGQALECTYEPYWNAFLFIVIFTGFS